VQSLAAGYDTSISWVTDGSGLLSAVDWKRDFDPSISVHGAALLVKITVSPYFFRDFDVHNHAFSA